MSIDKATVAKIAKLARIRVAEDKQDALAGELNNILGFVAHLSEVDVTDVEPMTSVVEMVQRQREDLVDDGGDSKKILANGPETDMGFYTVPKVVE